MRERRTVVGVDGSVAAFRALDAAASEAERRATALEIVCCVNDLAEATPVLRSASDRVKERHPDLILRASAVVGDPVQVLAERSRGAALTVVGARASVGTGGLLPHAVGQRLAVRAHGPLLVARGREPSGPEHSGPRGVLLGVGGAEAAEAALFAFEEAEMRRTHVCVLHAWTDRQPVSGSPAGPVESGSARPAASAACLPGVAVAPLRATHPQLRVVTRSVRGTPWRALLAATAEAELVVIAVRHRRVRPERLRLGPVAQALLRHSHCPVAVVPVPRG